MAVHSHSDGFPVGPGGRHALFPCSSFLTNYSQLSSINIHVCAIIVFLVVVPFFVVVSFVSYVRAI